VRRKTDNVPRRLDQRLAALEMRIENLEAEIVMKRMVNPYDLGFQLPQNPYPGLMAQAAPPPVPDLVVTATTLCAGLPPKR
jgi:hypothetical protein